MLLSLLCLTPLVSAAQTARFGEPNVTHLAFSPDGNALTAAYYRHAMNRPGTDWYSFATTWDLAPGKPTVLADALGPVAYSPDGKALVSGLAERSPKELFRVRPYVRLAFWRPGEAKPTQILTAPTDRGPDRATHQGSVVTFAFHPGGKHVAVASVDQVWWQPLDGKPQAVATLPLSPDQRSAVRLTFHEEGKLLRFTGRVGVGRVKLTVVTWTVETNDKETKFTEVSREEPKEVPGKMSEVTAVSPDGAKKATAAGPVVTVTDVETGKVLQELKPKE